MNILEQHQDKMFQEIKEFLEAGNRIFSVKQNWDDKTGELISQFYATDVLGKKLKMNLIDWSGHVLWQTIPWRKTDANYNWTPHCSRFMDKFDHIDHGEDWEIVLRNS